MPLPATTTRVNEHTRPEDNAAIDRQTAENVACYAAAGYSAIEARLRQLDREWDIERVLEANASSVLLVGLLLGTTVNRRWLLWPTAVGGFLLQHALQGWCPPLIWFRRMGFRTAAEIARERYALKALRGDFENLATPPDELNHTVVQQALARTQN